MKALYVDPSTPVIRPQDRRLLLEVLCSFYSFDGLEPSKTAGPNKRAAYKFAIESGFEVL